MVKLNKKRIRYIISKRKQGMSTKDIALGIKVSQRRVQQIYKAYSLTGNMPELNKSRRPKTELTEKQKELVDREYTMHRVGARLLKVVLDEDYPGNRIPKNKIYEYLKNKGFSALNKKKQKQRKRTRYERKHSGSLGHMDTHFCKWNPKLKLVAFQDDASRKLLAAKEFSTSNAQTSILVAKEAIKEAWNYRVTIRAINTDRGTEFFANREGRKKGKRHDFLMFLDSQGIKHIPSRVKNPQTNGKIERFHQEYEKHRSRFSSLEEFVNWYNDRIHGELRTRPQRAFRNKLPPESLIGMLFQGVYNEAKK